MWHAARLAALVRAGYQCEDCAELDWNARLEVHHVVPVDPVVGYRGASCAHHGDNLRALCVPCHRTAHARLRTRVGEQMVLLAA